MAKLGAVSGDVTGDLDFKGNVKFSKEESFFKICTSVVYYTSAIYSIWTTQCAGRNNDIYDTVFYEWHAGNRHL